MRIPLHSTAFLLACTSRRALPRSLKHGEGEDCVIGATDVHTRTWTNVNRACSHPAPSYNSLTACPPAIAFDAKIWVSLGVSNQGMPSARRTDVLSKIYAPWHIPRTRGR